MSRLYRLARFNHVLHSEVNSAASFTGPACHNNHLATCFKCAYFSLERDGWTNRKLNFGDAISSENGGQSQVDLAAKDWTRAALIDL